MHHFNAGIFSNKLTSALIVKLCLKKIKLIVKLCHKQRMFTVGMVPVIRCPRGNAAEMVSEKLDKKLRDNLRDARSSLFTGDSISTGQVR